MGMGNFEGKGRPIVKYREYCPYAAAMRPFVKLLWPLVASTSRPVSSSAAIATSTWHREKEPWDGDGSEVSVSSGNSRANSDSLSANTQGIGRVLHITTCTRTSSASYNVQWHSIALQYPPYSCLRNYDSSFSADFRIRFSNILQLIKSHIKVDFSFI